jgi:nitrile hydratase
MNGIHDLGGMHGFGPIEREENEPVFHEDWERRIFGVLNLAMGAAQIHVDEIRHAIEKMPPAEYLSSPYYEHWLYGAERVLAERGIVTREELDKRTAELAKREGK